MTSKQEATSDVHEEFAPPEAWDAIAAGYAELVAPGEQAVSSDALGIVGLARGESFLDVAAGPGGLGLAAARLGATVVATDWSPQMIAGFEALVRREGLHDTEAHVMDAHALTLPDDTFDVTGSQFGVMLVPDQPLALREMVRVTKPGGRVLLVAYGPPAGFEALQFFVAALQAAAPAFAGLPDPPPLEFQVSDPEVLRERLATAGLDEVHVDVAHQERLEFRSGDDCWSWVCSSNPVVGMILDGVSTEERATAREVLDGLVRERAAGSGVAVLTAPLNIGWGYKPALP